MQFQFGRASISLIALSAMALLCAAPASAAGIIVGDPEMVVKEVTGLLADAKPDEAVAALSKYLSEGASSQSFIQNVATAFKIATKPGKALVVDEVWSAQFGNAIVDKIEYLNFPPSDNPNNEFVALRYTFMKTPKGWQTTNVQVSGGLQFPPSGWVLTPGTK